MTNNITRERRLETTAWATQFTAPRFVTWRLEDRGGPKPTKVPYSVSATMVRASVTDPATWGTYDEACRACSEDPSLAGIGIVLVANNNPITAIDLDDAIAADCAVAEWARPIIDSCNSYTELSPSGTGVHVLIAAHKPECLGTRSKVTGLNADGTGGIEVYDRKRYIAITGWPVKGFEEWTSRLIEPRQGQLDAICAKLWPATAISTTAFGHAPVDHDSAAVAVAELTTGVSAVEMAVRGMRCRRYLDSIPPAISGQGGHNATFRAACEVFRFGLNSEAAWKAMEFYNENRCTPSWSLQELQHKFSQGCRAVIENGTFASRLEQKSTSGGSK